MAEKFALTSTTTVLSAVQWLHNISGALGLMISGIAGVTLSTYAFEWVDKIPHFYQLNKHPTSLKLLTTVFPLLHTQTKLSFRLINRYLNNLVSTMSTCIFVFHCNCMWMNSVLVIYSLLTPIIRPGQRLSNSCAMSLITPFHTQTLYNLLSLHTAQVLEIRFVWVYPYIGLKNVLVRELICLLNRDSVSQSPHSWNKICNFDIC